MLAGAAVRDHPQVVVVRDPDGRVVQPPVGPEFGRQVALGGRVLSREGALGEVLVLERVAASELPSADPLHCLGDVLDGVVGPPALSVEGDVLVAPVEVIK